MNFVIDLHCARDLGEAFRHSSHVLHESHCLFFREVVEFDGVDLRDQTDVAANGRGHSHRGPGNVQRCHDVQRLAALAYWAERA